MAHDDELRPAHGGYRKLKSFQVAQLVFDFTVRFCERYVDKRSRTTDQMVQAARSGSQNIGEGSKFAGTSQKMEIKLTNVARASLEELKLDYEDFLRQRKLPLWPDGDPKRWSLVHRRCKTVEEVALWIREMHAELNGPNGQNGPNEPTNNRHPTKSSSSISSIRSIQSISPAQPTRRTTHQEIAANAAHVLIGVASALLDRQLAAQAKAFIEDGGFTERLYRKRSQFRRNSQGKQTPNDPED